MDTQVNKTEPQSGKLPQALIWIAAIALILFSIVGIAAVMGWIPNSMGGASDKVAAVLQPSNAVAPPVAKEHRAAAPAVHVAAAPVPAPAPLFARRPLRAAPSAA